jgi:ubiquitin-protein ligase
MIFIKNKKLYNIKKENKIRIDHDIKELDSLPKGIYTKTKYNENEEAYLIKIMVDKNAISIENTNKIYSTIPDVINFLIIIDYCYPEKPPKVLCQTNFCFPNLMDGRDLSPSIILKWTKELSLLGIANTIPIFIKKVITADDYQFYGTFYLNTVYDMKNFDNMLVSNFPCKIDNVPKNSENNISLFQGDMSDFSLIISDDAFVLFKNFDNDKKEMKFGKIVFWSSIFAINDMQINRERKAVRINFVSNDKREERLRLIIENILFFKETLIKRMKNLKCEVETQKLIKGKFIENKIGINDINNMSLEQIEEGIKFFQKKLDNNEINFYVVNTFNFLSSKCIEYYSKVNSKKQMKYVNQLKQMLQKPKVQEILTQNKNKNKQEGK